MQRIAPSSRLLLLPLLPLLLVASLAASLLLAQSTSPGARWQHRLLDGSTLIDECDLCGRPTLYLPIRGTFDLVLVQVSPLGSLYALTNIDLAVGWGTNRTYRLQGHGSYQLSHTLPAEQSMELDLSLDGSPQRYLFHTATNSTLPGRDWPMLGISLVETQQASPLQRLSLELFTAPLREIWFFTTAGMTATTLSPANQFLVPGDLLSDAGRVVRPNLHLLQRLGLMPPTPPMPLDALHVLPGGEVVFSTRSYAWSETLGGLGHGDLLSERGRIVLANASLLAPFQPNPPAPDVGLDGAQVMTNGETWFSIDTPIFSERLGLTLGAGDILSDSGRIIRSFKQLIERFQPTGTPPTGLDAFHAWPHDEFWFSTETGFTDARLGAILAGDLLSSQGYVVFRNLELTQRFAPLEDLADFGLCGLFLITDRVWEPQTPTLKAASYDTSTATLHLQWEAIGQVFQVEHASQIEGPFLPASPLLPALEWAAPTAGADTLFHRVRQW